MSAFLYNLVGFLILLHAIYSANQYKALASILQLKQQGPPIDVLVQCFLAFLIIILGQLSTLRLKTAILLPHKHWTSMESFLARPDSILLGPRHRKAVK